MEVDFLKVSCVLICFNQESYIDDSVRSILSQDYPVDEFIFSDDCSTDNTFLKLREAVNKYGDKKNIIVRRNEVNIGLIAHINLVMAEFTGEIVVVSAGDDISYPNRVTRLVETYLEKGRPMLIHSKAVAIDKCGEPTGYEFPDVALRKKLTVSESLLSQRIYLGASGAWSRVLIDKYGPISYPHTYEDLIMGFRAVLEGKIEYVDECLLAYRIDVGITAKKLSITRAARVAHRISKIRRERDTFLQRRDDIKVFGGISPAMERKLDKKIDRARIRSDFYEDRSALLKDFVLMPISFFSGVGGEIKFLIKFFSLE